MDRLGEKAAIGRFEIEEDRWIHGELNVAGEKSSLYLRDPEFFMVRDDATEALRGELNDLTKVTCIKCNEAGPGSASRNDTGYSFAETFPHYVVHGDEYLDPKAKSIFKVEFRISDEAHLFADFGAFASLIDAKPFIAPIVAAYGKAIDHEIEVGDRPQIAFFSGKSTIFEADTVIGKVSARHYAGPSGGGARGVRIDNQIWCAIAYDDGAQFDDVINHMVRVMRFLSLIVGRPQSLVDCDLVLAAKGGMPPERLKLYWSFAPQREPAFGHKEREPLLHDMLMRPADEPDVFASVLAAWLARDAAWLEPRGRLAGCLEWQNRFDVDRLVAAANMFDLLPDDAVPKTAPVSDEMRAAVKATRETFLKFEPSPERQSVLQSLGRIGKPVLKRKVRHRAQIVLDSLGDDRLKDLFLVCDQAVDCRNRYVHGSETDLDHVSHFGHTIFFTATLEFVFAAADLIECGWDAKVWWKLGTTQSHPFGAFKIGYAGHLADLKKSLAEPSAGAVGGA